MTFLVVDNPEFIGKNKAGWGDLDRVRLAVKIGSLKIKNGKLRRQLEVLNDLIRMKIHMKILKNWEGDK